MAELMSKAPRALRLVAVGVVVAVVIALIYLLSGGGTKSGTAYFKSVNSVYPGDAIRILGMQVGQIDKITPDGDKVRVDFHYNSKYSLPADVKAAIMSPTLVATRFIQLDPAYTSGPKFENGGVIPVERTAVPVEFDELKKQLDQISDALGPNGANSQGALNRALTVIDKNGRQDGVGQGQNFHDMITSLSKAAKTLSDGRGDLFGTVANLARFSSVLNNYDSQIVEFDHRLADVSGILADNDDQLHELLPRIDDAGRQVDKFLHDHGDQLTDTVDKAGSISRSLAQQRDNIAQALHIAPNTLTNFTNLFNPRTGRIMANVTLNNVSSFGSPGDDICSLITQAAAADVRQGQDMCVKYLGPVFKHLAMQAPPVAANPVTVPTGSEPSYGDIDNGKYANPSPNGSSSDVPRSSTANGNDHSYSGPGGLIGLMQGGTK
jgi:phospholipid/cholesterol/gamma-HCH transport system substrate-binding protein